MTAATALDSAKRMTVAPSTLRYGRNRQRRFFAVSQHTRTSLLRKSVRA
jgi:hypothetical protein